MKQTRTLVVGQIMAMILALLLTACGSDEGSSKEAKACTAKPSGTPVRIGNVGSYSGPFAAGSANAQQVIKAWACSVNETGGIDGHPVELIVKDDAGNPATALTAVKSLIEQDKVVAIVSEMSTGASAWASYASSHGVPVVGGQNTDLTVLSDPNFYPAGGNILSMTQGQVLAAKENGPKVAILYCAEIAECSASVQLVGAIGQPLGMSVAYSAGAAADAPDFTAQCLAIKKSGAQSYLLALLPPVVLRVYDQCKKLGVTAKLVQSNQADSTLEGGANLDGVSFTDTVAPFWSDESDGLKDFHAAVEKYAPSVGTAELPLTNYGVQAWAGGKLFEAAVKAAGVDDITADSVKNGLYALKDETLDGLIGPVTFTPGKPTLTNCWSTYELGDGDFTGGSEAIECADESTNETLAAVAGFITAK